MRLPRGYSVRRRRGGARQQEPPPDTFLAKRRQGAGWRDGQRSGTEEGALRANTDSQAGPLPEIYATPLLFAAALDIAAGIWGQRRVVASLLKGVPVPIVLLAITVPEIKAQPHVSRMARQVLGENGSAPAYDWRGVITGKPRQDDRYRY